MGVLAAFEQYFENKNLFFVLVNDKEIVDKYFGGKLKEKNLYFLKKTSKFVNNRCDIQISDLQTSAQAPVATAKEN